MNKHKRGRNDPPRARPPETLILTAAALRFVLPRRFSALGLLCALLGLVIAAPSFAQDVKVLRIATGPIDTTEFPFGGLVGNAISNPPGSRECDKGGNCGVPGLIANSISTEGAYANLKALLRGDVDLALSQADVVNWSYHGTGEFEGQETLTRLRVLARLYPSTIHLIARKAAKITSIKDLAGKRVAVDGEGTGTRFTVKAVLAAYGVRSFNVSLRVMNVTAAAAALKDGKIDAMFLVSGAPVLALQDLSRAAPFNVIPLGGPIAEKLTQAFPFYTLGTIPANTYGEHPEVATVDVATVLVSRDDLDDELGFGIARAVWHERNIGLFEAGHPRGKLMNRQLAARGMGVPIQVGAARYYMSQRLLEPPPRIIPAQPSRPLSPTPAVTPKPAAPALAPKPATPAAASSATAAGLR
jgi:TRAP transporter TAXI family solute receptor